MIEDRALIQRYGLVRRAAPFERSRPENCLLAIKQYTVAIGFDPGRDDGADCPVSTQATVYTSVDRLKRLHPVWLADLPNVETTDVLLRVNSLPINNIDRRLTIRR